MPAADEEAPSDLQAVSLILGATWQSLVLVLMLSAVWLRFMKEMRRAPRCGRPSPCIFVELPTMQQSCNKVAIVDLAVIAVYSARLLSMEKGMRLRPRRGGSSPAWLSDHRYCIGKGWYKLLAVLVLSAVACLARLRKGRGGRASCAKCRWLRMPGGRAFLVLFSADELHVSSSSGGAVYLVLLSASSCSGVTVRTMFE